MKNTNLGQAPLRYLFFPAFLTLVILPFSVTHAQGFNRHSDVTHETTDPAKGETKEERACRLSLGSAVAQSLPDGACPLAAPKYVGWNITSTLEEFQGKPVSCRGRIRPPSAGFFMDGETKAISGDCYAQPYKTTSEAIVQCRNGVLSVSGKEALEEDVANSLAKRNLEKNLRSKIGLPSSVRSLANDRGQLIVIFDDINDLDRILVPNENIAEVKESFKSCVSSQPESVCMTVGKEYIFEWSRK